MINLLKTALIVILSVSLIGCKSPDPKNKNYNSKTVTEDITTFTKKEQGYVLIGALRISEKEISNMTYNEIIQSGIEAEEKEEIEKKKEEAEEQLIEKYNKELDEMISIDVESVVITKGGQLKYKVIVTNNHSSPIEAYKGAIVVTNSLNDEIANVVVSETETINQNESTTIYAIDNYYGRYEGIVKDLGKYSFTWDSYKVKPLGEDVLETK